MTGKDRELFQRYSGANVRTGDNNPTEFSRVQPSPVITTSVYATSHL